MGAVFGQAVYRAIVIFMMAGPILAANHLSQQDPEWGYLPPVQTHHHATVAQNGE